MTQLQCRKKRANSSEKLCVEFLLWERRKKKLRTQHENKIWQRLLLIKPETFNVIHSSALVLVPLLVFSSSSFFFNILQTTKQLFNLMIHSMTQLFRKPKATIINW